MLVSADAAPEVADFAEPDFNRALAGFLFFFFQAEDGIRDIGVTGVQTCALPISTSESRRLRSADSVVSGNSRTSVRAIKFALYFHVSGHISPSMPIQFPAPRKSIQIGRASCRERV